MSEPTVDISRPIKIMATAFGTEPRASTTAKTRPRTMSEKYSAGPNISATEVSGAPSAATSTVEKQAATSAPMRQRPILVGVTATPKPNQRFAIRSMLRSSEPWPELQRKVQSPREQQRAEQGKHRRPDDRLHPAIFGRGVCRHHQRDETRENKSERAHRDGEHQGRGGDEQGAARRNIHQRKGETNDHDCAQRRHRDIRRQARDPATDLVG